MRREEHQLREPAGWHGGNSPRKQEPLPDRSLRGNPDKVSQSRRAELDVLAQKLAGKFKEQGPLTREASANSVTGGRRMWDLVPPNTSDQLTHDELAYFLTQVRAQGIEVEHRGDRGDYIFRDESGSGEADEDNSPL